MTRTIHKRQLCRQLARRLGIGRRGAQIVVNAFLEELVGALQAGHRLELRGFGTLRPKMWAGRRVVRPTGGAVSVPDSRTVGFTPGKKLRGMGYKSG